MQKQFFLFKKSRTLVSETADYLAVSPHATRKNLAKAILNLAKAIFNLAKGPSKGSLSPLRITFSMLRIRRRRWSGDR